MAVHSTPEFDPPNPPRARRRTDPRDPGLVDVMARLSEGDPQAVVDLYLGWGAPIAAMLRRHLEHQGRAAIERAELDGLVVDACFALRDAAGGWSPDGGALPWVWAERRLADVARRAVGQHADRFDPGRHDVVEGAPAVGHEAAPADLLGRLSERDPLCRLLADGMAEVLSDRDRDVFLEHALQQVSGDRSPAHTVAAQHGLTAVAVRQIVHRARLRLRHLAAHQPAYAPLGHLELLR